MWKPGQKKSEDGLRWGGMVFPLAILIWVFALAYFQWSTRQFEPPELISIALAGFPIAILVSFGVMIGRVLFRLLAKGLAALLVPLFARRK